MPGQATAWTIAEAYDHLRSIYGVANALTVPRHERFAFLNLACGDLSRCYRKEQEGLYPAALAQTFAWFNCLAEELFRERGGEILGTAMGEKYPEHHCGYCRKSPCVCNEANRPPHALGVWPESQRLWTLQAWQAHLDRVYGKVNRQGGVARTLNRLFEEVAEVGLVLYHVDGFNASLAETRSTIAREMTDILAWIIGAGVLLEVDIHNAVRSLYGNGCPVCHFPECSCRSFEKRPLSGNRTHRFMPAEELAACLA